MNRLFIVLSLLFIGIFISCGSKPILSDPIPKITAPYSEDNVKIDGILAEPVWQKAQSVVLRENKTGDSLTDSTYLTIVKTVWDQDNLYIAFICYDPDIWGNFTDRDQHLWTEEAVEVFIDTDTIPNTYVEIEVSPKNILFDSYIVDPVTIDIAATKEFDLNGIKTAVSVDGSVNEGIDLDRKWTVEISVPLLDLVDENYMITPGTTEWRINFFRIEGERTGESVGYAWSPTGARFHKPSVFGILGFGGRNDKK